MLLQPTLLDLNELTRRKSSRNAKPSQKVEESKDKTVKRMFGLATAIPRLVKDTESTIYAFVDHLENIQTLLPLFCI